MIADCDADVGTKAVADKYQVNTGVGARRLKQHRRERGDLLPRRSGHRPCSFDLAELAALVADQPDPTLAELREKLGVAVAMSTICTALKHHSA